MYLPLFSGQSLPPQNQSTACWAGHSSESRRCSWTAWYGLNLFFQRSGVHRSNSDLTRKKERSDRFRSNISPLKVTLTSHCSAPASHSPHHGHGWSSCCTNPRLVDYRRRYLTPPYSSQAIRRTTSRRNLSFTFRTSSTWCFQTFFRISLHSVSFSFFSEFCFIWVLLVLQIRARLSCMLHYYWGWVLLLNHRLFWWKFEWMKSKNWRLYWGTNDGIIPIFDTPSNNSSYLNSSLWLLKYVCSGDWSVMFPFKYIRREACTSVPISQEQSSSILLTISRFISSCNPEQIRLAPEKCKSLWKLILVILHENWCLLLLTCVIAAAVWNSDYIIILCWSCSCLCLQEV